MTNLKPTTSIGSTEMDACPTSCAAETKRAFLPDVVLAGGAFTFLSIVASVLFSATLLSSATGLFAPPPGSVSCAHPGPIAVGAEALLAVCGLLFFLLANAQIKPGRTDDVTAHRFAWSYLSIAIVLSMASTWLLLRLC